ncbi:MAG: resolvase, partial [Lachnospiraceae bacterium]|nr:resolvase [Lachnospiraceae bacterium]
SLKDTIELLILVELDRAEQEREITVKRIKDGIAASDKRSGRKPGTLDKMSDELRADSIAFLSDRSIKQVDLMNKYHISRNTLKKYVELVKREQTAE